MKMFEILLKNEKNRSYDIIGWLFTAINFFSFIYLIIVFNGSRQIKWLVIGASLVTIAAMIIFLTKRKGMQQKTGFGFVFIISSLTWFKIGIIWPGAANLLLYFFEKLNKRKLMIRVFPDKIIYPSFPEKTLHWEELSNVMLKDGLITIDFKNNKLIQATVDDLGSKVNEMDFNEFCKKQLAGSIAY